MSRQLVIIENEGRPDIVNDAKNIVICTNNTKDGKFKRYTIYIDEKSKIAINKEIYTNEVIKSLKLKKEELAEKKAIDRP